MLTYMCIHFVKSINIYFFFNYMENSAFNLFASHYVVFGRNSIDDLSIQLYPEVDFYNDW